MPVASPISANDIPPAFRARFRDSIGPTCSVFAISTSRAQRPPWLKELPQLGLDEEERGAAMGVGAAWGQELIGGELVLVRPVIKRLPLPPGDRHGLLDGDQAFTRAAPRDGAGRGRGLVGLTVAVAASTRQSVERLADLVRVPPVELRVVVVPETRGVPEQAQPARALLPHHTPLLLRT